MDTFQLQLGEFPFPDNLGSLPAVSSERQNLTPRIARNSLLISRLNLLVSDGLLLLVPVQLFKRWLSSLDVDSSPFPDKPLGNV